MAHMLVRHRIEDFKKWKPIYEADKPARTAAGLKELHLWRNLDDPNEIVLLFEAADIQRAKALVSSAAVKETMQKAGVVGSPEIVLLSGA